MNILKSSLFVILFVSSLVFADILKTEVIPLYNHTAEEVLPTIQPLVEQGGSITAFQSNLIVKSTEKNIAEIKEILKTIDMQIGRAHV